MKRGLVSVNRHMTGAKPSHDGRNHAKLIQDITINNSMLRHDRGNTETDILIRRIAERFPSGRVLLKDMKEWPHDYEAYERMTGMTNERMMTRKRIDGRGVGACKSLK